MAVKTITIDMEAYERLHRLKGDGRSFSQVIKDLVPPLGSTAGELLEALEHGDPPTEETLDAIDTLIDDRVGSPVRIPEL